MQMEKSCGAIVYRLDGSTPYYLLIRHANGGHWSFPKGHVEVGESEAQTALREIQEETSLTVDLDTRYRFETQYSPRPGVLKDVVYFLAQTDQIQRTLQAEEVTDSLWLPYEEALAQISYPSDQDLLKKAQAHLA